MRLSYKIISELSEKYGDTFYLLDQYKFRKNYLEMLAAFQAHYPKTYIAYSYKTNYTPQLCKIIQEEGGFAEVVSEMEYDLAKRVGVDDNCIYYNGPYKKAKILESVLLNGAHVNIDSQEEADIIVEIARKHRERKFEVGIRCNFDIGNNAISRFGIDTEGAQLSYVISKLRRESNLRISGLHCHFPDRTLETYEKRVSGMLDLIQKKVGWKIDYISLGGGFFGRINEDFAREFKVPIPTFEDYGKAIGERLRQAYGDHRKDDMPMLLIEPGSALVADTMCYVTRVVSLKRIRGRDIAILTGSLFNINPNAKGINRPVEILRNADMRVDEQEGNWDLTGYTCIESDVMYQGLKEKLQVGDYVVFKNVGSYSIVFKPPFILPNVPVIGINGDNETYSIVKRAETAEKIFCDFRGID